MYKAVVFDLDGVIVSADEYHYRAWKMVADEERIYFDKEINQRLRSVSRMDSLEILLEESNTQYSRDQKNSRRLRKRMPITGLCYRTLSLTIRCPVRES